MEKKNLINAKKPFLNADICISNADSHRFSCQNNLRLSACPEGSNPAKKFFGIPKRRRSQNYIRGNPRKSALKNTFSLRANLSKFQFRVFKTVTKIPFGQVRTYKWVARKIGNPRACRAVGQALKSNPYPFVIPCHRVIKSDGSIGGYTLGVNLKKELLIFEKNILE